MLRVGLSSTFRFFRRNQRSLRLYHSTFQSLQKSSIIEALTKRLPKKEVAKFLNWFNSISNEPQKEIEQNQVNSMEAKSVGLKSSVEVAAQLDPNTKSDYHRNVEDIMTSKYDSINLYHPIFGELLCDLKFKRIYLTNLKSILSGNTWKKQRIYRPDRALRIFKAKSSKNSVPGLPGVITMYSHKITGECGVVDGQHRIGALTLLAMDQKWDTYAKNITVDVFEVESETEIANLFHEINSAEPVRLIDMPEVDDADTEETEVPGDKVSVRNKLSRTRFNMIFPTVCYVTQKITSSEVDGRSGGGVVVAPPPSAIDIRGIITEAAEALSATYPDMFKESQRCRPPHVNVDVLRDELFQSGFVTAHRVDSSASLRSKILEVNAQLEGMRDADLEDLVRKEGGANLSQAVVAKAVGKARVHRFFLGLSKSWLNTP